MATGISRTFSSRQLFLQNTLEGLLGIFHSANHNWPLVLSNLYIIEFNLFFFVFISIVFFSFSSKEICEANFVWLLKVRWLEYRVNQSRQEQPPQLFYKKTVLKHFAIFTRCFPVNIAKFLRTRDLKNICERMLPSRFTKICDRMELKRNSEAAMTLNYFYGTGFQKESFNVALEAKLWQNPLCLERISFNLFQANFTVYSPWKLIG